MSIPEGGHGYLETVATETEVWIVAETKYYYFFVTDEGWLGFIGKSDLFVRAKQNRYALTIEN